MLFDNEFDIDLDKFKSIIKDKKIIIVDGIIGAGKTTTIKTITQYYNKDKLIVHPIYEPVDEWRETGALNEFYQDIKSKCLEFQTFTFITRIKRVIKEVLDNPNYEYYILERSIWTDRYMFVELLKETLGPVRMKMYRHWWDMWYLIFPIKPTRWVLLDTSLEESIKRICKRDRCEEKHTISIDYQNSLLEKHHIFYQKLQDENQDVVIISKDTMDTNFLNNQEIIEKLGGMIIK